MKNPWPIKKLGECLVQFDRGISWSRKDEGGTIAVLRIPNIQEGNINLGDLKYIDAKNGNGELGQDDIVMVASNGNPDMVGRSAIVTEKEAGMRFASFLVRLRFDDTKLVPPYAHLFLLTPIFKLELRSKIATTSGIYNLRKEHIEKIKIFLPPLKIQKEVVERMEKITEAQKLNNELIKKAEELFQSLLHRELDQRGKNWVIKKLGEVADFINGKAFKPKDWGKKGLPIIRIQNLNNKDAIFNYYDGSVEGKYLIHNRDLLLSWSGNIGTSFGAFIWNNGDAVLNQHIFNIKIEDANLDKNYFYFFINKIVAEIEGKTHGITGLVHITKGTLEKIKIPLPFLKIQKQIVEKLSAVQEYKKQLLAQKSLLKELFDSVLYKSMKGEMDL